MEYLRKLDFKVVEKEENKRKILHHITNTLAYPFRDKKKEEAHISGFFFVNLKHKKYVEVKLYLRIKMIKQYLFKVYFKTEIFLLPACKLKF